MNLNLTAIRYMYKLLFIFSATFWMSCSSSNSSLEKDRPNIIVILCDDLGYGDVGFNGSMDIKTPNLDDLALNGTKCSAGYVAHPFCGPSRAALMTGRYPHKFGSQFNLKMNSGELLNTGIPLNETFISKVLQESGYHTGIVGKWHLGAVPKYHPHERGFDDFFGFLGGGHKYFPHQYQPLYEKQVADGNPLINDYLKPLEHNGKTITENEYITDALSREATRFVEDAASNKADPFFLYLAYNAPHSPLEAKSEDLKLFENIADKKRRTYAAMVYAVDRGVGSIVNKLKETGQYENTLIVFLSDNGGKLSLGANNGRLREGKGSVCEGGFRVPMLFHWSGHIAANHTFDHPVSALDLYPTIAHLAKAEIDPLKRLDGKNIWLNLTEQSEPYDNENIYVMRHRPGYSDMAVRKDEWKALRLKESWSLYNIKDDIGETNDLKETYPNKLKEMVADMEQWSKSHTEPRWFDPQSLDKDWDEKKMAQFPNAFVLDPEK